MKVGDKVYLNKLGYENLLEKYQEKSYIGMMMTITKVHPIEDDTQFYDTDFLDYFDVCEIDITKG